MQVNNVRLFTSARVAENSKGLGRSFTQTVHIYEALLVFCGFCVRPMGEARRCRYIYVISNDELSGAGKED